MGRKAKENISIDPDAFNEVALRHMTVHLVSKFEKETGTENARLPRRSGFIMKVQGRYVLMTAAHNLGEDPWWLKISHPPKPGFPDHPVFTTWHLVGTFIGFPDNTDPVHRANDFAFCEIDFDRLQEDLKRDVTDSKTQVFMFSAYASEVPDPSKSHRFWFRSWIDVCIVPSQNALDYNEHLESGMAYIGDDAEGYHLFHVEGEHLGDRYKGTSGTPIMNQDGFIVSMVKGGLPQEGLIRGTPVGRLLKTVAQHVSSRYAHVIDDQRLEPKFVRGDRG